jgi:predicted Zn-dependent peptidase
MHYDLTTLPNGLRIISQDMPSVHSVSIGMWVDTGSRDEEPIESGASHFLEHLLFKGSERLSANEISEALDAVGARHNAFTSKEYTCYWARTRDADLPLAIDILSEMIQRPAFRQDEIDSERHVVLEEINMNEDDPTDVAHEMFVEGLWEGHPLAPPILGTRDSINAMTRDTIAGYWGRRYTPHSVVVAAAGRVDHADVVSQIEGKMGGWSGPAVGREKSVIDPGSDVRVTTRDTEQAHLVLGGAGLRRDDDRRWALTVVDHVLGGGMSSRLFREIRERRGLAYAVHSFRMPFLETGAIAIYVGTSPDQTGEVLGLVRSELNRLMSDGLTGDELSRAKGHVKGSLALSLEDTGSRMNRLGRNELIDLEHLSVEQVVEKIEAVTAADALAVARDVYAAPYVLGAVGPFSAAELTELVR